MMKHLSRFHGDLLVKLCALCVLILLGPIVAQGATYYVATTGNDSNPGTLGHPFLTFKKAVGVLKPGDTLYIRGGTWTEQIDLQTPNISGAPGAYITIAGYVGETVTLQYADPTPYAYGPIKSRGNRGHLIFENLVLDGVNGSSKSGWILAYGNHHFIVRNIEIKNFKHNGLAFDDAIASQVIRCKIHDQVSESGLSGQRWYGIYHYNGSDNVIEDNEIYNNPGGGIHAYYGPHHNLIIRNNSVHDNNFLTSSSVGGILVQGRPDITTTNVRIYNNLVYGNSTASGVKAGNGISVNQNMRGAKVWNNTVYGNKTYGIAVTGGMTTIDTVVQNNIMFGNFTGPYIDVATTTKATNNLTTDPLFEDAAAFNFYLREDSNSGAIDKGVCVDEVKVDFRNTLRPQGGIGKCDIGAYEIIVKGTLLGIPKDLTVN